MKKKFIPFICLFIYLSFQQKETLYFPEKDLGPLFEAVQMERLYKDSKTFADNIPKKAPDKILADFLQQKSAPGFDLRKFVEENFIIPQPIDLPPVETATVTMAEHLPQHWKYLTRPADTVSGYSSLIPLPNAYVVPGGRFREIYYWDSYFTMLGLAASDRNDLVDNMLANFTFLIDELGFIPNGNRSYFLSRSQPPFYSSMVMLQASLKGDQEAAKYLPQLKKEYAFWMKGSETLKGNHVADGRVVKLANGETLNRYYDNEPVPRPESYYEDVHLGDNLTETEKTALYSNIRAACESGWDFSSRWFKDGQNLATIATTEIVPVDLNALLYHLESSIAQLSKINGDKKAAATFSSKAASRKKALMKYCWNDEKGFFYDYNFVDKKQTDAVTLAGAYPLYYKMADQAQAEKVASHIEKHLLLPGGLVTTLKKTGQQWDYPNGWAPLQWIAIDGLKNYGKRELANEITGRWLQLNERVFKNTGKMMEKYNVADLSLDAGGGEYDLQDGFGWTNGVAIALINQKKQK